MKQTSLFKPQKSDHGGNLKGVRKRKRPLSTTHSVHLVLRTSHGGLKKHSKAIEEILIKFGINYYVSLNSFANVGNHLHLQIKLQHRDLYAPYIRAITAAIMMKVTGFSRWKKKPKDFQFWNLRPFTRIASSYREFLRLKDYIAINIEEAKGLNREQARHNIKQMKLQPG
jgi:hypothetical protein